MAERNQEKMFGGIKAFRALVYDSKGNKINIKNKKGAGGKDKNKKKTNN